MALFPSLFFTCDIAHAFDLSAVLRGHGVRVYPVSGQTPDDEERKFYRLFREGAIDGLASCGVLSEGFDAPNAAGAFLCRPTKSGLLYRQQVGRVLRPFPAPKGERYYQQETLAAMLDNAQQDITLQLAVLPTGTGKTFIAAHTRQVIEQWKRRRMKRLLFLVHRDNLATQAADSFRSWCPDLSVGVEKAGLYAGDADVVVGSVQTLGPAKVDDGDGEVTWEYNPRLRSLNPDDFDGVIVDEAHHATKGKYYHNVLRWMRLLKGDENLDPGKLLLLITATPNRADNIGMEVICDKIVYEYELRTAVSDKFLADIHAYRVETSADLSDVHTDHGDLNIAELARATNTPERNELVAREYLKIREQVAPDLTDGRKPYAVVVDFCDLTGRHSLITASTLFGLRDKFDAKGKSIVEQAAAIERLESENPGLDLREENDLEAVQRKLKAVKTSLHRLDLLKPPETPEEIRKVSRFTWLKEAAGAYRLGLMDGAMLSVRETALGGFEVFRHTKGIRTKLYAAKTLGEAVTMADKEIPDQDRRVMAADASWRREPCTEKQVRLLYTLDRNLRGEFHSATILFQFCLSQFHAGQNSYSRGEISRRIDSLRAARA